eukprot:2392854-Alexandrium_andersonii.AAC.1
MSASLVGSEMCIRDRLPKDLHVSRCMLGSSPFEARKQAVPGRQSGAVSYTHLTLPTICSV